MTDLIKALWEVLRDRRPAVVATVVEAQGASPAKVGAQILLLPDGTTVGTVGGGSLEAAILVDARETLVDGKPRLAHYTLREEGEDAIGTLCGGELLVFLQPYNPPPKLVIVGGGHIGRPLQVMGEAAGFDVVVVDVEPGIANVSGLDAVDVKADTYVVLITTDHISDEAALRKTLATPARYIGMIGSLAKCQTILDHLREDTFDEQTLARIYAPVGLDLGGHTPGEIAAAILAEVIAVRRGILPAKEGISTRRLSFYEAMKRESGDRA